MQRRGQSTALLVGILLHGLDAAPAGVMQRQFCHHDAGYVSDCVSDPHCWRLGQQDGMRNAWDCQRRCAEFAECRYFTLHRSMGFYCDLLGANARFSPKLPRAISGDPSCELIERPLTCYTSAGYADAFANETGFKTLESCKGACDESPSCSIFSFNQYLRTCHFLDGHATYYPWLIGVVSGRRGCELPADQLACKTDFAFTEAGVNPMPLDSGVDNPDACQMACLQDSLCKYFTFNAIYGRCWKLSGNATLFPLEGTISGKRDCNMSNICSYRYGSYSGGEVVGLPQNVTQGATTARECRHACREKAACEYFSFQLDFKSCELQGKGAVVVPGPYYVSGGQDCQLPATVDKFCLEDSGAYVDPVHVLSAPNGPEDTDPYSCQQACVNSSSCNFFTFNNASRQCWLLERAYLSASLFGYWSGQKSCRLPDPGHCKVDKGYAHPGAALPNFGANSPTTCLKACQRDPACRFFTFNVLSRSCWLLGQDAVFMETLPGVISGPPDCVQTAATSKALVGSTTFMKIFFPHISSLLKDTMTKILATDCPAGKSNFWGQGTCSGCPNGSTRRRGGMTRCIPCDSGTYNPGGQDDCVDNDELIVTAASAGNKGLVVILRDRGTDMQLALRTAAWHNHTSAVWVLVEAAGAGGMLMFKAAVENATECSVDPAKDCRREFRVMDDLWHANKDVGSTEGTDLPALVFYAVQRQAVRVMQRMAVYDLIPRQHSEDNYKMPIFRAAIQGNVPMSQVLIDAGESVEWKNKEGLTPIDEALLNGHDDEVSFLEDHARGLQETLADPKTHTCIGVSFALSVAFWFAQVLYSSSLCRRSSATAEDGGGSSSDEGASIAASRLSEEDGYLRKAGAGEGKASRGAMLLAAKACSPASRMTAAILMRFLALLANFVFPGTFCARYVEGDVWLFVVVQLYVVPTIMMHGCKTVCEKPALLLSFTDFNWLGMHDSSRHGLRRACLSLLRALLILPLAIFLGGPRYHQEYATAAENAPFMLGAWYSFCLWLELHVPSISGIFNVGNMKVNSATDLISFDHWYPTGQVHAFPLKLCPKVLSHCIFQTSFDMYLAIISWFAVLGYLTCLWCLMTLVILCSHVRRPHLSKDVQASVHQLALEIDRRDDASELAELGPESEDLPKEVRGVMCANVKPVSALSVYSGAVFLLLDVALDANTILTMLISSEFVAGGVLAWFFFVSLLSELWDGSIFHLRSDSAEAVRRGFPVPRQIDTQDRERGFEALGSLIVMTAALLSAIKSPWQYITGTISLLSSANGLASYIFELVELPHPSEDQGEEPEEEKELEDGTDYSSSD